MLKLRNSFKNLKACFARRKKKASPEKLAGIGELAWKSINVENEPDIQRKMEIA